MTFEKPNDKLDGLDSIFPGPCGHLMPAMADIPEAFKRRFDTGNPYLEWQSKWFFKGLQDSEMPKPKPGIDGPQAFRHLSAIQRSFEPKHEHKCAAVAYLANLWFEPPVLVEEEA